MKTRFIPSIHGFSFANHFAGHPFILLNFINPLIKLIIPQVSHGLCGGMCFAAYDFFSSGKTIPINTSVPNQKSTLYYYIYKRQIHTYGFFGKNVAKFVYWSMLSNSKVAKLTFNELQKVKDKLNNEEPVILGIVYTSITETIAVWQNHQVLAFNYLEGENNVVINIYDPNLPAKDNVTLELSINLSNIYCEQRFKNRKELVRGFFVIPYTMADPPFIL